MGFETGDPHNPDEPVVIGNPATGAPNPGEDNTPEPGQFPGCRQYASSNPNARVFIKPTSEFNMILNISGGNRDRGFVCLYDYREMNRFLSGRDTLIDPRPNLGLGTHTNRIYYAAIIIPEGDHIFELQQATEDELIWTYDMTLNGGFYEALPLNNNNIREFQSVPDIMNYYRHNISGDDGSGAEAGQEAGECDGTTHPWDINPKFYLYDIIVTAQQIGLMSTQKLGISGSFTLQWKLRIAPGRSGGNETHIGETGGASTNVLRRAEEIDGVSNLFPPEERQGGSGCCRVKDRVELTATVMNGYSPGFVRHRMCLRHVNWCYVKNSTNRFQSGTLERLYIAGNSWSKTHKFKQGGPYYPNGPFSNIIVEAENPNFQE